MHPSIENGPVGVVRCSSIQIQLSSGNGGSYTLNEQKVKHQANFDPRFRVLRQTGRVLATFPSGKPVGYDSDAGEIAVAPINKSRRDDDAGNLGRSRHARL